jgi:hypothetical protein
MAPRDNRWSQSARVRAFDEAVEPPRRRRTPRERAMLRRFAQTLLHTPAEHHSGSRSLAFFGVLGGFSLTTLLCAVRVVDAAERRGQRFRTMRLGEEQAHHHHRFPKSAKNCGLLRERVDARCSSAARRVSPVRGSHRWSSAAPRPAPAHRRPEAFERDLASMSTLRAWVRCASVSRVHPRARSRDPRARTRPLQRR